MEPTQKDLSFDESVKQVMQSLPPIIRQYIEQGKYTEVAKRLMHIHMLRTDQAGVIEKEILLLLMGINNPDEFVRALAEEAKLDQQTINSITKDVNDQIFVPLREEMRKGMPVAAEPAKPVAPNVVQPASYFHLENKLPVRPTPPRPPASNIAPLPPKTVLPRGGGQPPVQLPTARPMDTSRLLEDHEEPHIDFPSLPTPVSTAKAPSPVAETPLQQALRTVLPRPAEVSSAGGPPPNLPGALPPRIPPKVEPPISQLQPKPAPPTVPPPAPARPYSSDPYREPIE